MTGWIGGTGKEKITLHCPKWVNVVLCGYSIRPWRKGASVISGFALKMEGVMSMLNMFKKSFWVPYEESDVYPAVIKAHQAISKYCEEKEASYSFTGDDEVVINEKVYEIYRGYENGSRGNYGIKCREK